MLGRNVIRDALHIRYLFKAFFGFQTIVHVPKYEMKNDVALDLINFFFFL